MAIPENLGVGDPPGGLAAGVSQLVDRVFGSLLDRERRC
jgi:hypothetical protein